MYLCKNVDRQKSLPKLPLIRIASHKEAARKDPAVHVSLSSDSLFKQPGNLRDSHLRKARRVVEAHASENHRIPFHCSSEELQRRVIAPTTSGWRADGRYIGFGLKPCQPQINRVSKTHTIELAIYSAGFRAAGKSSLNLCRAALQPYSRGVLRVQFEGWNRGGGTQPPLFRPINEGSGSSLTGQGPNGIVPALI